MFAPTTKTDIAKLALSTIVSRKTADLVSDQAATHTELDPDSATVEIGSMVVGSLVAYKARPLTDKIVDKTVDAYQSWREKRQAKKTAE